MILEEAGSGTRVGLSDICCVEVHHSVCSDLIPYCHLSAQLVLYRADASRKAKGHL